VKKRESSDLEANSVWDNFFDINIIKHYGDEVLKVLEVS
jgi:hypothetical protein